MAKRIGIDIDNTVVEVAKDWWCYLFSKYEFKDYKKAITAHKYPYNLCELFDIPDDEDGFAYFKNSRFYSGLKPITDSVEVLKELKDKGYELYFISRVVGDHSSSKCAWVDKHFPFVDGILLAGGKRHEKEKSVIAIDYMIEDSLRQLCAMPDNVIKLHYETPYYQLNVTPPEHNYVPVQDWGNIREYFKQLEK